MSRTDQIAVQSLNALRLLVWAKTKDGQDGRNRPEPIRLPSQMLAEAQEDDRRTDVQASRARAYRERQAARLAEQVSTATDTREEATHG